MSDYPWCSQPPPWFGLWSSWNRVPEVTSTHGLALHGRWERNREKGEPRTMAEEGRCCSGRDKSKHWCLDCCSQVCYTLCSSCHQRVVDCSDYLVFNQWQAPVGEWRVRSRKKPSVSAPLYLGQYLGQWLHLPRGSIFHEQSFSVVSVADQCLGLAPELWQCHLYALTFQPRDGSRFLLLLISRLLHISLFLPFWYFCNLYRATEPLLLKYFMWFFFFFWSVQLGPGWSKTTLSLLITLPSFLLPSPLCWGVWRPFRTSGKVSWCGGDSSITTILCIYSIFWCLCWGRGTSWNALLLPLLSWWNLKSFSFTHIPPLTFSEHLFAARCLYISGGSGAGPEMRRWALPAPSPHIENAGASCMEVRVTRDTIQWGKYRELWRTRGLLWHRKSGRAF